jgi:hypothetical protein
MKKYRLPALMIIAAICLCANAVAQAPVISSYSANGCTYTVGVSKATCSMGPGTKIVVRGTNFGTAGGIVNTCDCPQIIVPAGGWTSTRIVGYVYAVFTNPTSGSAGIQVETLGGAWSAAVPYRALAAHITKLTTDNCTYIPGVSTRQCVITPGSQFTIYGSYFGSGEGQGAQVGMCDCNNPTIQSWNPGWTNNPKPTDNVITATAVEAVCGNSIVVYAEGVGALPSNPIPYTTCQ